MRGRNAIAIIMGRDRSGVLAIIACVFESFFLPFAVISIVLPRAGKPLPNGIYKEQSQARHGLNLSRGPDPRSSYSFSTRTPAM